ncbi:hypothetical protein GDO81_012795 [Engystomops pustulosus]|uniref:Uncharacterized protein n=1 Tax=Engystomops pustulosus TaxID=76066 RepID=A0AAV7AUT5_ENGPU|nr:hypothetical protein GDO81_012795 [Engystomops pustulosus]
MFFLYCICIILYYKPLLCAGTEGGGQMLFSYRSLSGFYDNVIPDVMSPAPDAVIGDNGQRRAGDGAERRGHIGGVTLCKVHFVNGGGIFVYISVPGAAPLPLELAVGFVIPSLLCVSVLLPSSCLSL